MIPFPREELRGNLAQRFRRVAAAVPNRIAVKTPHSSLTYAELNRASDDLARSILAKRGPVEEPVGLLLEEGTELLTASLGILKAGKSTVVFNPGFPLNGLAAVWEDARKPLVITNPSFGPLADELTRTTGDWMDLSEPKSSNRRLGIRSHPAGFDGFPHLHFRLDRRTQRGNYFQRIDFAYLLV